MSFRVLVVDDDESIRRLLIETLSQWCEVNEASGGQAAVSLGRAIKFDVVLCDIRMDGLSGLEVLKAFKEELRSDAAIVMMTGCSSLASVVKATQGGAADYILKPFTMDHINERLHLIKERRSSKRSSLPRQFDNSGDEIIGESPAMVGVFKQIACAASTDFPISIQGELGTGKELAARAIHRYSARAAHPFIAVACGAQPGPQLESDLFGQASDAVPGAGFKRIGLFEQARRGTIFLDEIAETPLPFQAKLLRVIDEGKITPVGTPGEVAINVRVITASTLNLERAVNERRFRRDLFYRLNAITVKLPALRERRADIPLLIHRFIGQLTDSSARRIEFTPEAIERLIQHDWLGNVRELQHIIYRLVAVSPGGLIHERDLPAEIGQRQGGKLLSAEGGYERLPTFLEQERRYLIEVMTASAGNKREAARISQVDRKTIDRMLRTHNLDPQDFNRK